MILHVTNGEAAGNVIAESGVAGTVLTWDDVLHDGPVPGVASVDELREVRARFLTSRGTTAYQVAYDRLRQRDDTFMNTGDREETVLWFEHDLYDQLQLLQVLDRLADLATPHRVTLLQFDDYLGPMNPSDLAALFPARRVVTEADLACATEAWAAFTHEDPRWLSRLAERRDLPLPWVAPALRRLLAQYPGVRDGLSQSERLILRAVAGGHNSPARAFLHTQRADEPYFLGDSGFSWYLETLAEKPVPLVARTDGEPLVAPHSPDPRFWHGEIHLTDDGRAVLHQEADWVLLHGVDRWYGGVRIEGRFSRWRWDEARGLVEAG